MQNDLTCALSYALNCSCCFSLGTMLGEFKNARHKFASAIPSPGGDPIAPAEAMMRALWDGQTSRHG